LSRRAPLGPSSSFWWRSIDRHPYRPDERNYVPVTIIALAASLVLGQHLVTLLTNG
jgi:hypothetical protein